MRQIRAGISLDKNPIATPSEETVKQGNKAILAYFDAMEKSDTEKVGQEKMLNNEVKLILIGNSTAGKSTLLHYLLDGEVKNELVSTHGMEQHIWKPEYRIEKNGKIIKDLKVRILDLGGQEY